VHLLLLVVVALLVAWAVESVGMTAALAVVLLRARRGDAVSDHGDHCDRVDAPAAGPDDGRGRPAAGGTEPSATPVCGEPTGVGLQDAPDGHRHGGPASAPGARGGDDRAHAEEAEDS